MLRACITLCVLLLTLTSVPAVAAPRAADVGGGDDLQAPRCFPDRVDDVRRIDDDRHADEPRADIASWCVERGPATLGVSLAVHEATDPVTDEGWRDLGAGAAFRFTAADGTPVIANIVMPRGAVDVEVHVLTDTRVPTTLCTGPAATTGSGWRATLDVETCTGALGGLPEVLEVSAQMYYGMGVRDGGGGHVDVAPDAGTMSVPLSTGGDQGLDRFGGAERVATAIEISVASFADGGADAVVLARQDTFADAVVAAPLAVAAGAPVLLTGKDRVADAVLLEARRVLGGAGEVILLGGTAAIRTGVEAQLRAQGHRVTRVQGESRFATAVAVAREVGRRTGAPPASILLADGADFPDALVAGAAAPQLGGVVVLTDGASLPRVAEGYLAEHPDADVVAVGRLASAASPASPSAAGGTPALTSVAVARLLDPAGIGGGEVVVASDERFPDGLAGGAYAARRGAPLLLSSRDAVPTAVLAHLEQDGPFDAISLLGGTAALGDTVAGQVAVHLRSQAR